MITTKSDEKMVNILKEIGEDTIDSVREKYGQYLYSLTPMDLAHAEQQLFDSGADIEFIENHLATHIKLLVNPITNMLESLPDEHILKKLVNEHGQLDSLSEEIQHLKDHTNDISQLSTSSPEFMSVVHAATHLNALSRHSEILEKIMFPLLQNVDIEVILKILKDENYQLMIYSAQFIYSVYSAYSNMKETIEKLEELSIKLIPLNRRHMLIERNLLYPIALETLNEQTWAKLKEQCEKIGFCCFQ